jgi:hypothetical protein
MEKARRALHELFDSVRVQRGADDRVIRSKDHLGCSCFAHFPSDLIVDGIADRNIAQEAAFRGRTKVERLGDNFIQPVPA